MKEHTNHKPWKKVIRWLNPQFTIQLILNDDILTAHFRLKMFHIERTESNLLKSSININAQESIENVTKLNVSMEVDGIDGMRMIIIGTRKYNIIFRWNCEMVKWWNGADANQSNRFFRITGLPSKWAKLNQHRNSASRTPLSPFCFCFTYFM